MARRKIAVADSETDPFLHGRIPLPFLWGFYDGEEYYQFNSTESFVEFIKTKNIIIYAHNGGKFDWHFLADFIDPYQKIKVISGRIASVKIGEAELRDSYNLLPIPLDAYKKSEINYDIFEANERNKPENWKKISDYLKDDCIFLYEIVSKFIENYGLNLTLATSAIKFWQKNFYPHQVSGNKFFHEKFRQFYFGGRVECFKKGFIDHSFEVYDINSAYPFAMYHNHPWGFSFRKSKKIPEKIEKCFFIVEGISKGAFPFRAKNKLEFPSDNIPRTYNITGWELKAALELDAFSGKIIECYEFCDTINFKAYVDHFYNIKKISKNDKATYIISKLFLNSLYGKFCASPEKYRNYELIESQFITAAGEHENKTFYAPFGQDKSIVAKPLDDAEMRYYNIATGASVTGFVRAELFKHLHTAENPIYCDTDCIAAVSVNAKIGTELGEWESEGKFSEGAIAGKKMYAFKKIDGNFKTATKGVKLTPAEIYKVAKGEEILYKNIAPTFSIAKGGINFAEKDKNFISRKISLT